MSDIGTWVGIVLGSGGVGKAVYDLIKSRADARKVGADAAKTLVETAAESNKDLGEDLKEVRTELREVRATQRRHDDVLRVHHRWDEQVVDQLRQLGGSIADPPPLYLPEVP
ncbi:hypothetical protein QRX60_17065 [Amycolatopsis mongoliensis]|uniref:Uncharacterized protein n=1 Tax=Amycolatopsis mongoliensis TaxID=715475 RepID=A0A9Y2JWY1_9PSEU|nr:hypothetical protein [Amycolatopsis sp. 4-36]WIY05470.1 hypothetical protein QRX60_17065 [Amycolatopsis sp. 4-36]